MARPAHIPMTFGHGLYPTDPEAAAIYRQYGLKGHNGDDYASGQPVPTFAAQPGIVVTAGWVNDGGGNSVRIRFKWKDGREYIAQHDHLSRMDVKVGQSVQEGQQVGMTGTTGSSTGIHLHFSVRPVSGYNPNDGYYGYVNPAPFYESQGGKQMTNEQAFGMCFITVAQRWPTKVEESAWQKSGLAAYTWVQRHAPNVVQDQERLNAFAARFITLATRWPTKSEAQAWKKSKLSAYEWCQKNAPNLVKTQKEREIQELNIKLEQYEQGQSVPQTAQDERDLQAGRSLRNAIDILQKGGV